MTTLASVPPSRGLRRGCGAALLLACASAAPARAQELPEFNTLRTPTSPAFVILGITPAQIQRPNRPGALAVSFLQQVEGATQGDGLPSSYAVEVAPYWLRSHPRLTFREYARGGPTSLYRDASLSFAITDSLGDGAGAPEDDAHFRRVGMGLRTTLRAGHVAPSAVACADSVSTTATGIAADIARTVATDAVLIRLRREAISDRTKADSIRIRAARIQEQILLPEQEALAERAGRCMEQLSARHGLNIDVAVAGAVDFPGGRANAGTLGRVAFWLTPAWLGESMSHIGVARIGFEDAPDGGTTRLYDLGVRSVYAWQRFAASAEAVWRRVDGEGDEEAKSFVRLAAIFDAKLTDQTWLTVSAGKDFDPAQPNSLLALLGLKWQLGEQRVKVDVPTP